MWLGKRIYDCPNPYHASHPFLAWLQLLRFSCLASVFLLRYWFWKKFLKAYKHIKKVSTLRTESKTPNKRRKIRDHDFKYELSNTVATSCMWLFKLNIWDPWNPLTPRLSKFFYVSEGMGILEGRWPGLFLGIGIVLFFYSVILNLWSPEHRKANVFLV